MHDFQGGYSGFMGSSTKVWGGAQLPWWDGVSTLRGKAMNRNNGIRVCSGFAVVLFVLCTMGAGLAQEAYAGAPPLLIQPGTFITVRLNEPISSDRNQPGDIFSAELTQPVIVKGIVVARPGQTVGGRVLDAKRAGMVSGTSRLEIAATSLTLVDGKNVPIQTQLMVRNGRPAVERDAGALVATTATGALIGGVAGYGKGAAIGTGVGAAAGVIGILMTRGYSTVLYPETVLTFQVLAPVPVYTDDAPQAFRAVTAEDYAQAARPPQVASAVEEELDYLPPPPRRVYVNPYPYWYGDYPYYYYYPYWRPYYWGRPYYYGPSVSFYFGGPRYYGYRRPYYSAPRYYGPRYYGPHHYGGGHDRREWHGQRYSPPRYSPRPSPHPGPRDRGPSHGGGRRR